MELKDLSNVKVEEVKVARGDVWYVHREKHVGSEQMADRPALIVSNDIGNKHSPVVEIVYITTSQNKTKMPTHVRVSNFKLTGIALCEQVHSVDKSRLTEFVTHLNDQHMSLIDKALCISLEITKKSELVQHQAVASTFEEIPGEDENFIIKQANEKIKELFEAGKELYEADQEISKIMQADIILTGVSNDLLSEDLKNEIKSKAANTLHGRKKELEDKLIFIMKPKKAATINPKPEVVKENKPVRKAATINPEFEEAVKEMESSNKKAYTDEDVRKLYFDEGMTLAGVCKELRISQKTFYQILDRNGWQTRPRARR